MEDIINRKKSFSRERGWDSHWERLGRQWDFSNKELLQANKKITNPVSKKKKVTKSMSRQKMEEEIQLGNKHMKTMVLGQLDIYIPKTK